MAAGSVSLNSIYESKPARGATQHLRPYTRGSWKARAPSPSGQRRGAAAPASGTAWPPPRRWLCGSAPHSFLASLPQPERAATLRLARCCDPGASLLNEGTCVGSCCLAGPGAPSCPLSPRCPALPPHGPHPAIRPPWGGQDLIPPPSRGTAQTAGGAHGRRERAAGGSSAWRPARHGPGTFLGSFPQPWEASGLGSGIGALVGVPARSALPLPLLRKGQEKAAARVRSRWEAREAGKRTGSGFRATRAARPAPSYFLRDRARADAPRGKQPPASQAPGLALTSGTRRPPLTPVALNRDCYSSAARTRAVPATAGAGRLTWGRCAAATAPAATTGAAPPNTQGQGRTQVSRFVPKAGAEASQAAQLPSRELQARPAAEAKAHQPALRVLEPRRDSLEIPPSPGAPFVVLLLSPALLLPPGSLPCLQPRNPRCRGSRASVRCPSRGSPWEPAGGRPGGYHIQTFPHLAPREDTTHQRPKSRHKEVLFYYQKFCCMGAGQR